MKKQVTIPVFVLAMLSHAQMAIAAPEIRMLYPIDGSVVPADREVTISFAVDDFLFVDFKNNREPFPGNDNAGHVRMLFGEADLLESDILEGDKLLSSRPIQLGTLEEGKYRVVLEAIRNDNTRYDPPVQATSAFSVKRPGAFSGGPAAAPIGLISVLLGLVFGYGVYVQVRQNR